MRRITVSLAFLCLVLIGLPPTARAQSNDMQIAQALVGVWQWTDDNGQGVVHHQVTLAGDGTYAWTDADDFGHQVFAQGAWAYRDHYVMFQASYSVPLDPNGRPINQSPIQILDVGRDYIRTPAGLAHRAG